MLAFASAMVLVFRAACTEKSIYEICATENSVIGTGHQGARSNSTCIAVLAIALACHRGTCDAFTPGKQDLPLIVLPGEWQTLNELSLALGVLMRTKC